MGGARACVVPHREPSGTCGGTGIAAPETMNAEKAEADFHGSPKDPTATHTNGSPHVRSRDFARRAKAVVSKLPSSLDAQLKRSPYTTFGIALAIGMGAGILLGSRILRSVLASALSYAAIELGRAYLRETVRGSSEVG
jgi:hypothetical protein